MLEAKDVLRMIAMGEKLPQEEHPETPDHVIEILRGAEPALINLIIANPDDMVQASYREIVRLADWHGWYATCSVLCVLLAARYEEVDVDRLGPEGVSADTDRLLRSFVQAFNLDDPSIWTLPMAQLASFGRDMAIGTTVCTAICAAHGFLRKGGVL